MLIRDLLPQFKRYALYERGITPNSYKAICSAVEMLCWFAKTDSVRDLDTGIIREFLLQSREDRLWSPKTFRNYRQNLKCFFNWCIMSGLLKKNPVEGIEKPRIPKRLPRCLSKEKALKILANASWHPWKYQIERSRNTAILATFLFSGLRLKELINLQVTDVNFGNSEIFVLQGKGRKDRIVPIHPRLSPFLREYYQERQKYTGQASQWFFTSVRSEKRLTVKNVYRITKAIALDSNVKFTPHMLRHTFAMLAIDGDLNIYKLKEIMGHAHVSTTEIYASVAQGSIKRSFNNIALI
jgi:site-specific recombinase XerD